MYLQNYSNLASLKILRMLISIKDWLGYFGDQGSMTQNHTAELNSS